MIDKVLEFIEMINYHTDDSSLLVFMLPFLIVFSVIGIMYGR